MTSKHLIAASEVRSYVDYDPDTGVLTWRARPKEMFAHLGNNAAYQCDAWNSKWAGKRAGSDCGNGYTRTAINGKYVLAHRIAWAWMTGEWPSEEIDHINCDPSDNRWCNLRAASRADNAHNMRKPAHNTTGHKGLVWNKQIGKWGARIYVNRKLIGLGHFASKEEAIEAYLAGQKKYHGEFSRAA